jgi:hypothetical protein
MPTETRFCTCQKFCQAPPEGKEVSRRTWYNHAPQRRLEEDMTEIQRDSQRRITKRRRVQVRNIVSLSLLIESKSPQSEYNEPQAVENFVNNFPSDQSSEDSWSDSELERHHSVEPMNDNIPEATRISDMESSHEDNLFNLDEDEDISPEQPRATLKDLANMQDIISDIRNYSFSDEEAQWSSEEFDSFCNPRQELVSETWDLDDPQFRLSLQIYLSLSAHSSEATYKEVRESIKQCYSDSNMLSFNQV